MRSHWDAVGLYRPMNFKGSRNSSLYYIYTFICKNKKFQIYDFNGTWYIQQVSS